MIKPNRLLPIDDCNQHKVNMSFVLAVKLMLSLSSN